MPYLSTRTDPSGFLLKRLLLIDFLSVRKLMLAQSDTVTTLNHDESEPWLPSALVIVSVLAGHVEPQVVGRERLNCKPFPGSVKARPD